MISILWEQKYYEYNNYYQYCYNHYYYCCCCYCCCCYYCILTYIRIIVVFQIVRLLLCRCDPSGKKSFSGEDPGGWSTLSRAAHYSDVIIASLRLQLPPYRLFFQQLIQANNNKKITVPHYSSFVRTIGRQCGTRSHVMASSSHNEFNEYVSECLIP